MTRTRHRMHLLGGLLLAPAAWAVNTQLGLVLPEADCSSGWRLSLLASLAFAATALAGSGFARSLASHQPLGGLRPETRGFPVAARHSRRYPVCLRAPAAGRRLDDPDRMRALAALLWMLAAAPAFAHGGQAHPGRATLDVRPLDHRPVAAGRGCLWPGAGALAAEAQVLERRASLAGRLLRGWMAGARRRPALAAAWAGRTLLHLPHDRARDHHGRLSPAAGAGTAGRRRAVEPAAAREARPRLACGRQGGPQPLAPSDDAAQCDDHPRRRALDLACPAPARGRR